MGKFFKVFALLFCIFIFCNEVIAQRDSFPIQMLGVKWFIVNIKVETLNVKYKRSRSLKNWMLFNKDNTFSSLEDGVPNSGKWNPKSGRTLEILDNEGTTFMKIISITTEKLTVQLAEGGGKWTEIKFSVLSAMSK